MTPLDDHLQDDGLALDARIARCHTTAVDLLEAAPSTSVGFGTARQAFDPIAADRGSVRAQASRFAAARPRVPVRQRLA